MRRCWLSRNVIEKTRGCWEKGIAVARKASEVSTGKNLAADFSPLEKRLLGAKV